MRFPTDYEIGLHRPEPDLERCKENVSNILTEVAPLFGGRNLTGALHTGASARHLQVKYSVHAARVDTSGFGDRIENYLKATMTARAAALATTAALRMAFDVAPPVYIGIAAKQSLGARLEQHLAGLTGVADRIADLGLSWRHLEFRCTPIDSQHEMAIPNLEKLLQTIFKPHLSER